MNTSADLFEDGYPHGTPEGYRGGCRGGACPAAIEIGMSCRQAEQASHGDYRYSKLVREGATPARIARVIYGAGDDTDITSAAQPLAERSQNPAPQEDAVDPAIEEEAPTAASEPDAEGEEMGHPTATTKESAMPVPTPPRSKLVVEPIEHDIAWTDSPAGQMAEDEGLPLTIEEDDARRAVLAAEVPNDDDDVQLPAPKSSEPTKAQRIRAWAREQGMHVGLKGTIRRDVIDAYNKAHPETVVVTRLEGRPVPGGIIPAVVRRRDEHNRALAEKIIAEAKGGSEPDEASIERATVAAELAAAGVDEQDITDKAIDTVTQLAEHDVASFRVLDEQDADAGEMYLKSPAQSALTDQEWAAAMELAKERAEIPAEATVELERPEWAAVPEGRDELLASRDAARDWATRLEQELANTQEQLAIAHRALEFTLAAWGRQSTAVDVLQNAFTHAAIEARMLRGSLTLVQDLHQLAELEAAGLRLRVSESGVEQEPHRRFLPWRRQ